MKERETAVKKRAAYDMKCDEKDINITNLQTERVLGITNKVKLGADGCGQRRVYDNIDDKVYAEGAAPNPVTINNPVSSAAPVSTYKPYNSHY